MDLFGRYLFRQLAGSFLLILVTLTTIIWLATALTKLDLLTSKGQSVFMMLQMTSLALPALVAIIAPNALLVAALYTLDRMNGDSEVIVMSASGAPVWRFARPFLALGALLSVVVLLFNLLVTPASLRQLRAFISQVRTDLVAQVLQPGRFTAAEDGLTFHIRDRAFNGELVGLMVHDTRGEELNLTYLADRGQIVSNEDGSYLVMRDGHIHRQKKGDGQTDEGIQIVAFEQYVFDITQYGPTSEGKWYRRDELYLHELMNPDPENPDYMQNPGRFRAELHDRLSSALYPLVHMMIVISLLAHPRTVRESRWASISLAFGIAVLVRAAGLAAINLLALNPSAIALVYGVPVGAILVAALTAHVKMAPHTRLGINLGALPKLPILNNKFWAVMGVKTEQDGGHVG